ncbi:MAG: cell division protein FtsA [Bacteroidales bacterium]|nr:cell division protein FtsA [Bacteroidales bacterium]
MEEKNIVAIDLGTSKIALTVAKVNGNDVQIAYYKEMPSAGIKYSSVWNINQATDPLSRIIRDAEEALDIKITQAVIGMPKYPVRQESNSAIVKDRGEDTDITAEDIADLKSYAEDSYPLDDPAKEAIYGAVAQSFSDGEYFQIIENDIIGMASDTLEGNFKIFIGKKSDLKKIDSVMTKTGIAARKKYFTADTTAKAVLTDAEMENGVALIDFGGGSTSVSIYHGNIMRHYASIPFGGKNITDDIKSECQISERLAENIKLAYGACMPEKLQSLSEKVLQIRSNNTEPDKQVTVKYLSEIITARIEEIIMAMLYEINESGFADMLRSGIVITGGAAQTANLGNFIYELSGYRVRTGYPKQHFSNAGCDGLKDTTAATSIGLILAAKDELGVNCAYNDEQGGSSVIIENGEEDVEVEAPAEVQTEPAETDPAPQSNGKLFSDDEIEVVEKPKKKNKSGIFATWRKAKQKVEEALDKLSEEQV